MKRKNVLVFSVLAIFLALNAYPKYNINIITESNSINNNILDDLNMDQPQASISIGSDSFSDQGNSQGVSLFYDRLLTYKNNKTSDGGINIDFPVKDWNMTNYQLEFSELSTSDIYVPFEIRSGNYDAFYEGDSYAISFTVPNSCYLNNISLLIQYLGGSGTPQPSSRFQIRLYNATDYSGSLEPNMTLDSGLDQYQFDLTTKPVSYPAQWFQSNFSNILLDISRTANNTFFAVFYSQNIAHGGFLGSNPPCYYAVTNEQPEDQYKSILYKDTGSGWAEMMGKNGLLRVNLSPLSYTPSPEQVNLTVLGTQINSSGKFSSSEFIEYDKRGYDISITSPWFAEVYYNLTFNGHFKYDTSSTTSFNATTGSDVIWNSSKIISNLPLDSSIINETARFYKPSFWNYDSNYNGTQQFSDSNVIECNDYVDIINISNAQWTVYYNQTNAIEDAVVRWSSNQINWYDVQNFVNITDFLNVTASVNNSNGNIIMRVKTSTVDIYEERPLTGTSISFPLWSPALNTSAIYNNTKMDILLMVSNGTMAGAEKISLYAILSQMNITLLDNYSNVFKTEKAYYYLSTKNLYNDENLDIDTIFVELNQSAGAWKTLIKDYHYLINQVSPGQYNFTMDTSIADFISGNHTIRIRFQEKYFFNYNFTADLKIKARTMEMTIWSANEVDRIFEYGDFAEYYIYLNDTDTFQGVENAQFMLKANFSGIPQVLNPIVYSVFDQNNGNYTITLITQTLYQGKPLENLSIEFYAKVSGVYSEVNKNDILKIINITHVTSLNILANSSNIFIYGKEAYITLQYYDLTSDVNISGADIEIWNNGTQEFIFGTDYSYSELSGIYNITFNLREITPGFYNLTINASKPYGGSILYQSAEITFNFTLSLFNSRISVPEDYQNQIVYQEQFFEVIAIAKDDFQDIDILNATVLMNISNILFSSPFSTLASNFGWYRGIVNIGFLSPGLHTVVINMTAKGYISSETSINITVVERKITSIQFSTVFKDYYVWGEGISLRVKLTEGGVLLPNTQLIYEITENYEGGASKITTLYCTTDTEGICESDYIVAECDSIQITVVFVGSVSQRPSSNVQAVIDVQSTGEYYFNLIAPFLPFIIGGMAAATGIAVYRRHQKKKAREILIEKAGLYSDAYNIEYLLILHKITGGVLYQNDLAGLGFDANLIGGLLQAITSFSYGIQKKKVDGKETSKFLFDYADYKIMLRDGDLSRIALIVRTDPSENLSNFHALFIQQFEAKYKALLAQFSGDLRPFRESLELAKKVFRVNLLEAHAVKSPLPMKKMTPIQERMLNLSITFGLISERKVFNIQDLIKYLVPIFPELSWEEIAGNIFELVEKGFLIPAKETE